MTRDRHDETDEPDPDHGAPGGSRGGDHDDHGVRLRTVVLAAVGSAAVCWAGLRWWDSTGRALPVIPWLGLVPLALVAGIVLLAGWQVRQWTRYRHQTGRHLRGGAAPGGALSQGARGSGRPPMEITAFRARGTLVAAQAAALGGGVLIGWYTANAMVLSPDLDVPVVQNWWWRAALSALASVGVAAAGMTAQALCRIPPEDDGRSGGIEGNPAR